MWYSRFSIYTILGSIVFAADLSSLCPVSQDYDNNQSFHRYPFLVYHPFAIPRPDTSFNCMITRVPNKPQHISTRPTLHLCNRGTALCPVREENLDSALSVAPWPQQVDALKRLGNKETINVFFLGGSMTRGAETACKCLCTDQEDKRCPPNPVPPLMHESYCSWTSHIARWLQRTYPPTNFAIHDYSAGGHTSQSAGYFIDRVRSSTANLSNPALFFLDFSVNDAQAQVFSGLETFIRTIYLNFGQYYGVRPTIFVLEQYAHPYTQGSPAQRVKMMHTHADYAMAYRRICRHYHVALISLREVYWTYYGEPKKRNLFKPNLTQRCYPLSPFVHLAHVHVHPPWYVHLFMADVLAACILRIKASSSSNTATTIYSSPAINYISISTHTVPIPLYDLRTEMQHICDLSVPYAVDAITHSTILQHQVNMSHGWVELLDHHTPGWVINNQANVNNRVLSFPISSGTTLSKSVLKISYLRSYEGMGTATVYLCGEQLSGSTMLDALWSRHVSIPYVYSVVLQDENVLPCLFLTTEQRTIDIVYTPGEDQYKLRSVHQHQFKIFAVQLCQPVRLL